MNILYMIRIIIFHALFVLLTISLFLTSKTNPGTTPVYWGFQIGDEDFKKKTTEKLSQLSESDRVLFKACCLPDNAFNEIIKYCLY